MMPYCWGEKYSELMGPRPMLEVLKNSGMEVHMRFMQPIAPATIYDRKLLTTHVYQPVIEAIGDTWTLAGLDKSSLTQSRQLTLQQVGIPQV